MNNDDCPIDFEGQVGFDLLTLEERRRYKREKGSDINPAEVELFLIKTFGVDFDEIRRLKNESIKHKEKL